MSPKYRTPVSQPHAKRGYVVLAKRPRDIDLQKVTAQLQQKQFLIRATG